MLRQIILLFGIFLTTHTVYAAEQTYENTSKTNLDHYPKTYNGKAIIPRPYIAYDDSSEVLRHKKHVYAHASLGLIGMHLQASYFLNPDTLVDLSFMYQKDSITGISQIYTLSLSRFVADTLYFRGGPALRSGNIVNYLNTFGKTEPSVERATDIGMELGIGNRWQWNNLSIGAEWFAIYVPLIVDESRGFDFQFRIVMVQLGVAI